MERRNAMSRIISISDDLFLSFIVYGFFRDFLPKAYFRIWADMIFVLYIEAVSSQFKAENKIILL